MHQRLTCHITRHCLRFPPPDFVEISEFKHEVAITKLFPNELGTRVAFIDEMAAAYLYNPVNDHVVAIPSISPNTSAILWDQVPRRPCHSRAAPLPAITRAPAARARLGPWALGPCIRARACN